MSKMKEYHKYVVNTKASCFLCVSRTTGEDKTSAQSMLNVFRYLNIDIWKLANNVNSTKPQEIEVMVVLCGRCCKVINLFDKMYQELELIKLKLNASVKIIHDMMATAELDTTSNKGLTEGKENTDVSKTIRDKLIQKCSLRINSSFPQVKLKRLGKSENSVEKHYGKSEDTEHIVSTDAVDETDADAGDFSWSDNQPDKDNLENGHKTDGDAPKKRIPTKESIKGRLNHAKCKLCGKIISNSYRLKIHMRTHTGERPFSCSHCSQRFGDAKNLHKHTLSKHRKIIFVECRKDMDIPDEKFEAGIAMLFQNITRDKDKNFLCEFCGKLFGRKRRDRLEHHMIQAHFGILKDRLQKSLLCDKIGKSKLTGESSGEIHGPRMCLECNICGKVVQRRNLKSHKMIHTGEKPLLCPHCPERFRIENLLRKHQLIKHRPIIFAECRDSDVTDEQFNKGIVQLFENLKEMPRGKGGLFSCNFCSKNSFVVRRDMEVHQMQVHFDVLANRLRKILDGDKPKLEKMGES